MLTNPGPSVSQSPNLTASMGNWQAQLTFGQLVTNYPGFPAGTEAFTTDQGPVYSNGTTWVQSTATVNGRALKLSAASSNLLRSSAYALSRAAKARAAQGLGFMKVLIVGDSTTVGVGATGYTAPSTKVKGISAPSVLAALITGAGMPATAENMFGDNGGQAANAIPYSTIDQRCALGAGWVSLGVAPTLGGAAHKNATTLNPLTFLPYTAVDTFDVYYPISPTLGSFTVSRSGDVSSPTLSQVGANAIGKYTLTGALGNSNALAITPVVNQSYLIGIDAYNSQIPGVRVINAGISGSKVAQWVVNTPAYDYLPTLQAFAPDLTIIQPGVNDAVAGTTIGNATTPGTYLGDLQTLITTCKQSGDVILVSHYPSQITAVSLAIQRTYVTALQTLAAANSVALNDLWNCWQSYELQNALSGGTDAATTIASAPLAIYAGAAGSALHPSANGYRAKAEADFTMFMMI